MRKYPTPSPTLVGLTPTLSQAFARSEATVAECIRRMRLANLISGRHKRGRPKIGASSGDIARVILGLLSCDSTMSAGADLERSLGLLTVVDGREVRLIDTVEMLLNDLVDDGEIAGVRDLSLAVSRPWPFGLLMLTYDDDSPTTVVEYHHEAARQSAQPDPDELIDRWGYRPGSTTWTDLRLDGFKTIADVIAGRAVDHDQQTMAATIADDLLRY